jgi:phage shock protein A
MSTEPNRPLVGVLLGFACVFFLFVKREEKKPPRDDAESLLELAQQQMREAQAKNRSRAVEAITQKNNLQALADQTQKMVNNLQAKAQKAREAGDVGLERELTVEQERYERSLEKMATGLQSAIEAAEAVKTAMRQEEESIRARTAQALAMKALHRQAQIEFEIEKSRLGMTPTKAGALFERAQAKIQQTQARRDLMARLRETAEVLEEAAEAAARNGDAALSQRLLAERAELKKAGLNPKLWILE